MTLRYQHLPAYLKPTNLKYTSGRRTVCKLRLQEEKVSSICAGDIPFLTVYTVTVGTTTCGRFDRDVGP